MLPRVGGWAPSATRWGRKSHVMGPKVEKCVGPLGRVRFAVYSQDLEREPAACSAERI